MPEAVDRWADLRRKSRYALTPSIIALGDFNMPKVDPEDPIYQALTARGLRLPAHSTKVGSNLAGDRDYDQIVFFPPGRDRACTRRVGRRLRLRRRPLFDALAKERAGGYERLRRLRALLRFGPPDPVDRVASLNGRAGRSADHSDSATWYRAAKFRARA